MKTKLCKLTLAVYWVLWLALLGLFWFGTDGSDAMGYSILVFWLILPALSFLEAFIWGRWGGWMKFLLPIVFGLGAVVLDYLTFRLCNTLAAGGIFHALQTGILNSPEWSAALLTMIPALAGLFLGLGIWLARRKAEREQEKARRESLADTAPLPAVPDAGAQPPRKDDPQ